jgi:glutaredoxin
MDVTLLHFDDCPNWKTTDKILSRLSSEYGFDLQRRRIGNLAEAVQLGFRGSPTVLIDGEDPFFDSNVAVGMSCRLYRGPSGLVGSPTEEMLRGVLMADP